MPCNVPSGAADCDDIQFVCLSIGCLRSSRRCLYMARFRQPDSACLHRLNEFRRYRCGALPGNGWADSLRSVFHSVLLCWAFGHSVLPDATNPYVLLFHFSGCHDACFASPLRLRRFSQFRSGRNGTYDSLPRLDLDDGVRLIHSCVLCKLEQRAHVSVKRLALTTSIPVSTDDPSFELNPQSCHTTAPMWLLLGFKS